MAIVNCTECKKEVSDQAATCPHCGSPIHRRSESPTKVIIESEPTSKKWKTVKLISGIGIFLGVIFMLFNWSNDELWYIKLIGFYLIPLSIISMIIGKIGAWYSDKRTR
jgi:DNA-directed RNA polymerase subunit RPC12/RpoP